MNPKASRPSGSRGVFDSGLNVRFLRDPMGFDYGPGVFGPRPEYRSLDAIRPSLRNPNCSGPDPVYAIAMDVCREEDRKELCRRMLLFGIVMYAKGRLGDEPVRSQGHVHAIAPHCGWSTPELFEIWEGHAIIYAQQKSTDDPGLCFAIDARPGERVIVPPGWSHYVVNADPDAELVFGAWCDRQYGFDYTQMRAHGGLAWFPQVGDGAITWHRNPTYLSSTLHARKARTYSELDLPPQLSIYELFHHDPECLQWVSDPARFSKVWSTFEP